jgi:nicotinate-nucleotide pyrophosphorylase
MPSYRFDIHEDGTTHSAKHDYQFDDLAQVRREAVTAGTDIAREVFADGKATEVVVDVTQDGKFVMKATISIIVTNKQTG